MTEVVQIVRTTGATRAILRRDFSRVALRAFAFYASVVLLLALATSLDDLRQGQAADAGMLLRSYALGFLPWLFLSPTIFLVTRASALSRKRSTEVAAETAGLIALCAVTSLTYIYAVNGPAFGLTGTQFLSRVQVIQWTFDIFIFGLSFLAGRVDGERKLTEAAASERATLTNQLLEFRRKRAQLEANDLRNRFSSHFVLNALNNVLGLVRAKSHEEAERAILALSEILKRVSRVGDTTLATLNDELDFMDSYLTFQQIRYPEIDLVADVDVDAGATIVPAFLLQPLIENAFKHGLAPGGRLWAALQVRAALGKITISFSNSVREGAELGLDGEGMALTRARLSLCYGESYSLSRTLEGGRHVVRLTIPSEPRLT
ncbi:MAG: histidine kinase [Terricaulis sp.]